MLTAKGGGLWVRGTVSTNKCVKEGILSEFLKENRAKVVKVMQLNYTFDRQIVLERREAREEGHLRGRLEEIISSVREGDYSIERGAEKLGVTVKEFENLMEKEQLFTAP